MLVVCCWWLGVALIGEIGNDSEQVVGQQLTGSLAKSTWGDPIRVHVAHLSRAWPQPSEVASSSAEPVGHSS
eukprot:3919988-Alexandrium_andersonii.AAC.1